MKEAGCVQAFAVNAAASYAANCRLDARNAYRAQASEDSLGEFGNGIRAAEDTSITQGFVWYLLGSRPGQV
jgi:hypothetical protein